MTDVMEVNMRRAAPGLWSGASDHEPTVCITKQRDGQNGR